MALEADEHHLILVGVIGIGFKIIWDWLQQRSQKRENGHQDVVLEKMLMILEELEDRQKKMWELMMEKLR